APPAASPAALGPGAAATVYLLLNNGDDAGTIFGLRGDVFNGAQLIGSGKLDNITGVTRSNPLSVTVNIPALVPGQLAAGEVLRLEVYGIVEGTGPHASATGLNLAFDAVGRNSRVFLRRRPIVANDDFYPQNVIGNVPIDSSRIPFSVTDNDASASGPFTITA